MIWQNLYEFEILKFINSQIVSSNYFLDNVLSTHVFQFRYKVQRPINKKPEKYIKLII